MRDSISSPRWLFGRQGSGLEATQGLLCSSFLGLLRFLGKGLKYTTQKGTTEEGLGRIQGLGLSLFLDG